MKSDIDRLMAARNLDALVVLGEEGENPHRAYLTHGAKAGGLIFKKRGEPAVMIVSGMEVEEAKKSGLQVVTRSELRIHEIVQEYKNDRETMFVKMYERFLAHVGIERGRVGVYGHGDLGRTWENLKLLSARFPAIEFVGERHNTLFDEAVTTKGADEIAILRDVGARTSAVMRATWDFIAAHRAGGDTVVRSDGSPLTIGHVKRFIKQQLLEHGLEEAGGHATIFAQGRDGGFPHSRGEEGDALRLGQAIVFDLFPRDSETGYFHDMTRTWSLGHASDEVQRAYDHVMTAFNTVMDQIRVGEKTQQYQLLAMDVLEEFGHPTARSEPGTEIGYPHSLGHGVGLSVHEAPRLNHISEDDMVQIGNVFTVEPGLYYPDDGYGVRIEDTVYINADGQAISLTPMHKELVLPLQG